MHTHTHPVSPQRNRLNLLHAMPSPCSNWFDHALIPIALSTSPRPPYHLQHIVPPKLPTPTPCTPIGPHTHSPLHNPRIYTHINPTPNYGTEPAVQPGPPQVDEEVVAMLTSMGFSVNGSKRAMLATGSNDPDTAMNWSVLLLMLSSLVVLLVWYLIALSPFYFRDFSSLLRLSIQISFFSPLSYYLISFDRFFGFLLYCDQFSFNVLGCWSTWKMLTLTAQYRIAQQHLSAQVQHSTCSFPLLYSTLHFLSSPHLTSLSLYFPLPPLLSSPRTYWWHADAMATGQWHLLTLDTSTHPKFEETARGCKAAFPWWSQWDTPTGRPGQRSKPQTTI